MPLDIVILYLQVIPSELAAQIIERTHKEHNHPGINKMYDTYVSIQFEH